MAVGKVIIKDADGNIGHEVNELSERNAVLVFDVSGDAAFWTGAPGAALLAGGLGNDKDAVLELRSEKDAEAAGITQANADKPSAADHVLGGVARRHIHDFFAATGDSGATLYVAFANCKTGWNALVGVNRAIHGRAAQMGVWTGQPMWKAAGDGLACGLVQGLQDVGLELATVYNTPVSIVLNADTKAVPGAQAGQTPSKVANPLDSVPDCHLKARYVTLALGQPYDDEIAAMEAAAGHPLGNVGAALGLLCRLEVQVSMAYVQDASLVALYQDNQPLVLPLLGSNVEYAGVTIQQFDELDDKGYVFLHRYIENSGTYFSKDYTCTDDDFSTISRNRVVGKSRRLVRKALLPKVNAPLYLNKGGTLSAASQTEFKNLVSDVLNRMKTSGEISGYKTPTLNTSANLLQTRTVEISYGILPVGCAETIEVTQGLSLDA